MSYTEQHAEQHTSPVGATLTVLACLTLTGLFGWHTASVSASSTGIFGTKVVDMQQIQRVWDAVRITKVAVAGQQIETGLSGPRGEYKQGAPFQADEDCLINMTLVNRTDKPIVYVQIMLWFPDTMNANPDKATTSYYVIVGQRPESALYYKDGSKIPHARHNAETAAPCAT